MAEKNALKVIWGRTDAGPINGRINIVSYRGPHYGWPWFGLETLSQLYPSFGTFGLTALWAYGKGWPWSP
jgi:hypothetical protein